ncbi:MAG: glycosyltransferase family A protein [Elusimicrobia bacterium]|nr:glycosyltransferase family A protein [Elusimicrobiota bacterium]
MPSETGISVIVITRGRPELLRAFLDSALAAGERPPEFLVGVNGPDPASLALLQTYGPAVTAVALPGRCRGEARNALAALASGRRLCFLDDDTLLPRGYFERLAALIRAHPECAVFGGGQELAAGAGSFETAVYALLASPWGGGPFTERFSPVAGTRAAGPEKFILCNLTLDRDFLRARGLAFEGHLTSAEENLLLDRMAGAGARMLLSGDLNLVHRRRRALRAFAGQVFNSGRGRAQITLLRPGAVTAFTLLPPAALSLAAWAALRRPLLLAAAAGAYAAVSLAAAARSRARPAVKPAVCLLFPVLHAAYAAGWLYGALEGLLEKLRGRPRPGRCRCVEKL